MGSRMRRALAWLALLLAALGFIAWQLQHPAVRTVDADEQPGTPLISAPLADWAVVELLHQGARQRFERDSAGQWLQHAALADEASNHTHRSSPAADQRIGSVLAVLARARIERILPIDISLPARLAGWGLANPALIVLIHGQDGRVLITLELGDVAPDGLSRYVQVPQTRQVVTVPNYHATGLLTLLAAPSPAASAP